MSETSFPARWWRPIEDGRIQCELCPRDCKLNDGQRGHCFVRQRVGEELILTTYGRSSGFCVDPIEKKPLHHFYPGSSVLSFGTGGCNLACRFCQNWDLSRSRDTERLSDRASPAEIAERARSLGCKSVAFTYNDPVVFAEYAMDTADACHELGIRTVAVTAGYMHPEPRREFYAKMDAANVDLKAFTEEFYFKLTGGHLEPILETLVYLKKETDVWFEITTLLIPGHNDSEREIREEAEWIGKNLGPDVPLHFSAFHPAYRMTDLSNTHASTLQRSRELAIQAGLRYVYTGNVFNREGDTTFCPDCRAELVVRNWYEILSYDLTDRGRCPKCDTALPGKFEAFKGAFGRRRVPVSAGPVGK